MKKAIIVLAIVLLLTANLHADITDVTIQPETPTMVDILSITVSGGEGYGPIQITDALVEFEDDLITLDVYLDIGFLTVVTP